MCQESRGRGVTRDLGTDDSDNAQVARERLEVQATRRIVEAEELAAAVDLLEAAVSQVGARALPILAERLGRAHGRAMARLRREQREAVRAALRQAHKDEARVVPCVTPGGPA